MFKRQHYIAFGLVLFTVLVILSLPERSATRLKLALGGLFLPLFGFAGAAQNLTEQFATSVAPRNRLVAEIERLRRENLQLQDQLKQLQDISRENAQLRLAVGWQKRIPWQMKLVRVVGQDPANWWRTILIDAGTRDGWIRTNMVVLVPEGLVGRVTEVGFDRSRVLLIGDPNCRFSAQVQTATEKGIIAKGIISPSAATFDRLVVDLNYLPGGSQVKPGQMIVTSGDGGIFPKGLVVGQIVDVRANDYGMNLEARVKLAVNLDSLEVVWVLTP